MTSPGGHQLKRSGSLQHTRLITNCNHSTLFRVIYKNKKRIVKGFPPVSPYIGVSPTLCYLLREKKPLCCLQLTQVCEHCTHRNAKEYNWTNKVIILAADYASTGIYNFVIPLRAHFRAKSSLNPIVLLLERKPDVAFLDSVSYFPYVYWMLGTIDWYCTPYCFVFNRAPGAAGRHNTVTVTFVYNFDCLLFVVCVWYIAALHIIQSGRFN